MDDRAASTLEVLIALKQRAVATAQQRWMEEAAALARVTERLATLVGRRDEAVAALAARETPGGREPLPAVALVAGDRYRARLERELEGASARVSSAERELAAQRWAEQQAQQGLARAQAVLRAFERHRERQQRVAHRRLALLDERRLDELRVRALGVGPSSTLHGRAGRSPKGGP